MSGEMLQVAEADAIVTIALNRPERRNALNQRMIEDLTAAIEAMGRRSSGVLILTGNGPAFCAGLDLEELRSLEGKTRAEHEVDSRAVARLLRSLFDLRLPTIAAVPGPAIAGGMGLATICDFTLSVPEAKFGYTEARIGFVPAIVSAFLVLQVGEKRARDLLLTGRLISAEEAMEWGLVNEIVRGPDLSTRAQELAQQLLRNSPESLQATKRLLSAQVKDRLDRELELAIAANVESRRTEDFREGVTAFLGKRTPVWPSARPEKAHKDRERR